MSDQFNGYQPPPNFNPPPPGASAAPTPAPAPPVPLAAPTPQNYAQPGPVPLAAPIPQNYAQPGPVLNPTPWRPQGVPQNYGQQPQQGYQPQPYQQQGYGPPQQQPGQRGDLAGIGNAPSSSGGSYLSFKSPGVKNPDGSVQRSGESGFHEVAVKAVKYEQSRDPDKHGAWMFVVETQVISSNVHQAGESRSVVYNMNHQPSPGNVKDFIFAVLQAMGYTMAQISQMIAAPGQKGGSQFDDVVRWVHGPENPAGKTPARLHVESRWHVTKVRKTEMTVHTWTPRPPQPAPAPQAA